MDLLVGTLSAFWLGILTSVSPCPLATNIAAISFAGKRISRPFLVFLTGLAYTLGRMVLYIVLGVLIVTFFLSVPQVSYGLQKYMNKALGPILILVGVVLLEFVKFDIPRPGLGEKAGERALASGLGGAFLMGVVFALSFCPVSAALFFGSLIPLSLTYHSRFVLPAVYGLGTGIPVLVFAVLLALGAQSIGRAFKKVEQIELWFRRITGATFILIGVYFSLTYIFHLIG
jgi:cytochrome c biogenesis protein CcdA